jgi:hypothetical protein
VGDVPSTYGFRWGVEPMVARAVQLRGLGAEGRRVHCQCPSQLI